MVSGVRVPMPGRALQRCLIQITFEMKVPAKEK